MSTATIQGTYIKALSSVSMNDLQLVGGKNASLGELTANLTSAGVQVPSGFVITADAYTRILEHGQLSEKLSKLLCTIDKNNLDELSRKAQAARDLIRQTGLPPEVIEDIEKAYRLMEEEYGAGVDVAVRSSATAEDLPDASFAGQQETFLNIRGRTALLDACLHCFASLFTDRAISYRIDKNFDHMSVRLSIGVQKMVRSDLAASGVIFTLDPESGFRDVVLVTSSWGLGENVVAGKVDPDEFLVFKSTLRSSPKPIVRRKIGAKQMRLIYSGHGTQTTRNVQVTPEDQAKPSLSDEHVLQLARWACLIEKHYSALHGKPTPMDIEWALDGHSGQLYIVQARPETVHSQAQRNTIESWSIKERGEVLLTGRSIGDKIGQGTACVIQGAHELNKFADGQVLVAQMTDPDWEPIMKRAAAIVTNRGGRTCHAAIVSRELGVPCVVGTMEATEVLSSGQPVTVSCAEGATGYVYQGLVPYQKSVLELSSIPRTRTKIMVNIGNPEHAFALAGLPIDGVGLAREEFIVANEVGVHPQALLHLDSLPDSKLQSEIRKICRNFASPREYFVQKLSEGIGTIAAAFYPRPVIVRLSDFKTNEYANLLGGNYFEQQESNPMIGYRGACRYVSKDFKEAFGMECQALNRVIGDMGLCNVIPMVPFCRTPSEGAQVVKLMAEFGLVRHVNGLQIYAMCELPSNVLLMEEFAEVFDGFSIGSNDLTQLVLGVDRDSPTLAAIFDERDSAVRKAISMAVKQAKAAGAKIGICGQAPSDYPEIVQFLIELGIDSISLNEDVVLKTILAVWAEEVRLAQATTRSGAGAKA